MEIFILLSMIFLSIVDDYYMQGILAKLKQKKWWSENAPSQKYSKDYLVALLQHSFSWAFMMMLPIFIFFGFAISLKMLIFLVANIVIHAYIDDLKANKFKINLIQDQFLHFVQIIFTWALLLI